MSIRSCRDIPNEFWEACKNHSDPRVGVRCPFKNCRTWEPKIIEEFCRQRAKQGKTTPQARAGRLVADFSLLVVPHAYRHLPMNFPDLLKIIEVVSVNWRSAWPPFLRIFVAFRSVLVCVPFPSRGCASTAPPC